MLVYQRDPEGKPPFSYGFPMVFLWFSWFSYGFHHKSHEISSQQGLRRCAAALHQSHPGFSWAPKKTACLVKKGGNHGENHGKTMGLFWGKLWGTQKKKPMGFCQTCRRFQKCFSPLTSGTTGNRSCPLNGALNGTSGTGLGLS